MAVRDWPVFMERLYAEVERLTAERDSALNQCTELHAGHDSLKADANNWREDWSRWTWDMVNAAFRYSVEPQCAQQAQEKNRERMAGFYRMMLAAAPVKGESMSDTERPSIAAARYSELDERKLFRLERMHVDIRPRTV